MSPLAFIFTVHGFVLGLGFVVSLLAVRLSIGIARRHEILARPSERGSHTVSTPRLGGIGVALGFLAGSVFVYRVASHYGPLGYWYYAMLVAGAWALIGGMLDDVLDLPASNKFLFQSASAFSLTILGGAVHQVDLPGAGLVTLTPALGAALTGVIVIFWINAFNFMDGMDGQAAGFAALVSLSAATFLLLPAGPGGPPLRNLVDSWTLGSPVTLLLALLGGCCLGLLVHNMPGVRPAGKTFMGDCGSHLIALLMAALAIAASQMPGRADRTPQVPLIATGILLLPFAFDVVYTLVRRIARGENILEAHRTHLYQRLLVCGWSHGKVLLLNSLVWIICALLAFVYCLSSRVSGGGDTFNQLLALGTAFIVMAGYTAGVHLVETVHRRKSLSLK